MPSFVIGRGDLDSQIVEKAAHLPTFPQEALTLKCNTYSLPADHIYCWQLDRQVDEDSNRIEHDTLQKLGATAAISLDCLQSRSVRNSMWPQTRNIAIVNVRLDSR
jgi:hypothetical protein